MFVGRCFVTKLFEDREALGAQGARGRQRAEADGAAAAWRADLHDELRGERLAIGGCLGVRADEEAGRRERGERGGGDVHGGRGGGHGRPGQEDVEEGEGSCDHEGGEGTQGNGKLELLITFVFAGSPGLGWSHGEHLGTLHRDRSYFATSVELEVFGLEY